MSAASSTQPYADIELAVVRWLEQNITVLAQVDGSFLVNDRTPPDLERLPVFVRVGLVSGQDDTITDRSVVDVEVFAPDRMTGYAVAEDIRARFSGRSHRVGDVVIDYVGTDEKPHRLPWENNKITRLGATYRVSARR